MATDNSVVSRYEGRLEIDDLRVIKSEVNGKEVQTVISRLSELRIVDVNTDIVLYTTQTCLMDRRSISTMEIWVKKGDLVCEWDPYNAVIISEYDGKVAFENVIEGVTYRDEFDEQTGFPRKGDYRVA